VSIGRSISSSSPAASRPSRLDLRKDAECWPDWLTPVLIQFLTLHNVPLTHAADLAEIDVAISAHVAWLDKNYADEVFLASEPQGTSGRRRDPRRRHHRQNVDDRFSLDPLNKTGLAECTMVLQSVPSGARNGAPDRAVTAAGRSGLDIRSTRTPTR